MEENLKLIGIGILLAISLLGNVFFLVQPESETVYIPCRTQITPTITSIEGTFVSSGETSVTINVGAKELSFETTNITRYYSLMNPSTLFNQEIPAELIGANTSLTGTENIEEIIKFPEQSSTSPVLVYTQFSTIEEMHLEPGQWIRVNYELMGEDLTKVVIDIVEIQ